MPVEVILPKVDMDMATGRISKWFVSEGALVKKGDVLFEIETDKAAMEIDAPATGILRNVTGQAGLDIAVGVPVAWIYDENETPIAQASSAHAASAKTASAIIVETVIAPAASAAIPIAPPALISLEDEQAPRATPLARRLAREAAIDLVSMRGSGPHGRINANDVSAAIAAQAKPHVQTPSPASGTRIDDVRSLFAAGSFDEIPHDLMRTTIARRLTEAKQTIPHFYLDLTCNLDALLKLRAELNAAAPLIKDKPSYKISVNDMIVKAMALALRAVPDANVSWTETAALRHHKADIAIAVSIPGGLVTPIVRNACEKSLSQLAMETKDLARRAREQRLLPHEYKGGTAAISNLGMFGIDRFTAIINPPQAMILAVGVANKGIVVGDETPTIATLMKVTLSVDHRVIDGSLAAQFLLTFKTYIEKPISILV